LLNGTSAQNRLFSAIIKTLCRNIHVQLHSADVGQEVIELINGTVACAGDRREKLGCQLSSLQLYSFVQTQHQASISAQASGNCGKATS